MARPWVGAETVNMDLTQFLLLRRRRGEEAYKRRLILLSTYYRYASTGISI